MSLKFEWDRLLVSFIERVEDLIRILSARLATKREQRDYEENADF
jgi:uncharacterized DUF497 family protein